MLREHVDAVLDPLVLCQAVRDDSGRIVDFTYLDVNEATCTYLSMERQDLVGSGMLSGMPGLAEVGLLAAYARAVDTGEPVSFDGFRYDNEILGLEANYDIRGRSLPGDRLSLTWRDVTLREQVMAQLAESEERLRSTLDTMLDPHVVLEAVRDAAGAIVDFAFSDANAAAAEFNGMSRDDLIGVRLLGQHPAAGTTTLFTDYVHTVETGEPLIRDDWAYPQDMLGGEIRYYDVRAVKFRDGVSQTWRDVTERFEAVQRIAAAEEQYRLLAENSADVVMHLRDGFITWMSPSVSGALGGAPADWIGIAVTDVLHPADAPVYGVGPSTVEAGESVVQRARVRAHDGEYHWIEVHAKAFLDSDGQPDGLVASLRVVDAEVAAERELERLARFDVLTGALNRAEALARLEAAAAHPRHPGPETGVLFCDVDKFKDINDTHGHAAGDTVLRVLTGRITASIRHEDLVARMGGDEFLVFLSRIHDLDEAAAIAEKIRDVAAAPIPLSDGLGTVHTSLSIGVALARPGEPTDALIARADTAMYEAKKAGRNTVTLIR
jgi:diguanylate cyclase (GGDEF)-like protein/PAS domain S-box-containing protein